MKKLNYYFYGSLIFLYISDMGAMIGIIWASLKITGSSTFLGIMLCISSLAPFLIKKICKNKSLSIEKLYLLRVFIYAIILTIVFSGIASDYFGLIITILLFGIINIFTLSVYETYNSYLVNHSYISSDLASRIMQTVLQSGAFLGAIISGFLLSKGSYETLLKIISIYEIILNILLYILNPIKFSKKILYNRIKDFSNNYLQKKEIKAIYLLCIPLGIIGIHISSFNILSTVIFQNINNWDAKLFGYASGFAGIGAFLSSIISFKKISFVIYSIILIIFDIIYSNINYPLIAIASCFFIGFSINSIRIYIRKLMLDIATSPLLSQKMGELSATSYVFFQSIGSVFIGLIISENMAGEEFSKLLLPIIGFIILLSSYLSITKFKNKKL